MKHLFAGLFCIGLLLGNVHAKLIGHWPLSPTKPVQVTWDADNADSNTWRTSSSATANGANIPIITLPNGDKVWEASSYKGIFSSALVPIDPSKQYRLSGIFRSTGSVNSKVYFGFLPILDNGTNGTQTPANWFRNGDDGIIQSWNDTTINLTNSITGWSTSTYLGNRLMGFYYDGDASSRPPDTIMYSASYGTDRGAYTSISGSTINLSYPLPSNITDNLIPGVSVVKNHYNGCGSYLYSVISGALLPQTWNTYSDISTGDGWTQTQCEAFRPFTRFVRIMMLLNYGQSSTSTIQFDKIILEEVQGDENATDGSYKIYDNAPLYGLAIDSRHHGSNYGAAFVEGPNGAPRGAMSFDGENDYIYIGDVSALESMNQLSVSAWIKTTSTEKNKGILTKFYTGTNSYSLRMDNSISGKIRFDTYTSEVKSSFSNTLINDGEWHHVIGIYNGITQKLYIDGIEEDSDAQSGTIANSEEEVCIGTFCNGATIYGYFNGSLSDVRIYDHALSQTEITALSGKKENFTSTATITTKNTNKTAIPKLLYWDLTTKQYWQGQTDGSLQRVSAPVSSFKNTTELTTIQTGKNATTGQLYWDTDKKKYYIGQPDGDLRPLSE